MIIPIRCMTCGKVLADKWRYVERRMEERVKKPDEMNAASLAGAIESSSEKTDLGKLMDELGLDKLCCRRHVLGHVDLVDAI
jgi:DNA-directed RNA polymerase subunit N